MAMERDPSLVRPVGAAALQAPAARVLRCPGPRPDLARCGEARPAPVDWSFCAEASRVAAAARRSASAAITHVEGGALTCAIAAQNQRLDGVLASLVELVAQLKTREVREADAASRVPDVQGRMLTELALIREAVRQPAASAKPRPHKVAAAPAPDDEEEPHPAASETPVYPTDE